MGITGLEKLKTDRDIAIYIKNASLALSQIAQAKGIDIRIHCDPEETVDVKFGDYEYIKFKGRETGTYEGYDYRPTGRIGDWGAVRPKEIRIGSRPEKEAPDALECGD